MYNVFIPNIPTSRQVDGGTEYSEEIPLLCKNFLMDFLNYSYFYCDSYQKHLLPNGIAESRQFKMWPVNNKIFHNNPYR